MATPTQATDNVAHAVGLVVRIVPLLIGKGRGRAVIAGIAGAVLHMLLDAPLARGDGRPQSSVPRGAAPVIDERPGGLHMG